MYLSTSMHCCAFRDFGGLNSTSFTPEKALAFLGVKGGFGKEKFSRGNFTHCLMVQKYSRGKGDDKGGYGLGNKAHDKNLDKFIALVRETGVGVVVQCAKAKNLNSHNVLKPAVFTPDHEAFNKWMLEKGNQIAAQARVANQYEGW